MFVKKSIRVSGVQTVRDSIGEYISIIVNDNVRFISVYRDPTKRTAADYDETMSLFTDTIASNIPTVYIGDFNWQLLQPTSPITYLHQSTSQAISVHELTVSMGSTFSKLQAR